MQNQEYGHKKQECWEEFKRDNLDGEVQWQPVSRYEVFSYAFDRAFALGKQEKDAEPNRTIKARRKTDGEIIEVKEWRGASDVVYSSPDMNQFYQASELDFNLDAEDIVISGWLCRDKVINEPFTSDLFLAFDEPTRIEEWGKWGDMGDYIELDTSLFPDLTWESDPEEAEIIIKRKKK